MNNECYRHSYLCTYQSKKQKRATSTTDAFYADLQATINKLSKCDMLLIIGDFNDHVDQEQHLTSRSVVGPHAVDTRARNGPPGPAHARPI